MELTGQARPGRRLVLAGGAAPRLGPLPDWVEHRRLVSVEELHDLFRSASCPAFPSLYEGFGLPPLEATASGRPVAAATSGSLPEVCGDARELTWRTCADVHADVYRELAGHRRP